MKDNLGYVHVYCGDGKGKTTTAMGLCTRAAGYGYKVLIYQFMKNNKTRQFPKNWNGKLTMKNNSAKSLQKRQKKIMTCCFLMN